MGRNTQHSSVFDSSVFVEKYRAGEKISGADQLTNERYWLEVVVMMVNVCSSSVDPLYLGEKVAESFELDSEWYMSRKRLMGSSELTSLNPTVQQDTLVDHLLPSV
jgi:hypothetical protein